MQKKNYKLQSIQILIYQNTQTKTHFKTKKYYEFLKKH